MRSSDDDVARELRDHLDLEIEELMARGLSREAARAAAMRTVGNVTLAKEQVHDLSSWTWLEQLWQDVRYALRTCGRAPAFAATAIVTLALAVGANGAIFSVIDALALQPLPVAHPERLVVVRDLDDGNFAYPDYVTLRDANRTLDVLVASSSLLKASVNVAGDAGAATAKLVSANYFSGFGVLPGRGRLFEPEDDAAPAAVLGDEYWTRRFGRSPDILGRQIRLLGIPVTVVGVAPPGFFGETPGEAPDLWGSMAVQRRVWLNERGFTWLYLVGRLKQGASVAQAQADLTVSFASTSSTRSRHLAVEAGAHGVSRWRDRVGGPLWILMAVVLLVLLIACTNLATLLLTRGAARRSEIAMRLAIGASRGRIVRQLMTEAVVLAAAGGALSLALAAWGGRVLVRMASAAGDGPELSLTLGMNARLVLFTIGASVVAGALFGAAPAFREIGQALRRMPGAHARVVGRERAWGLRGALIATQVALSLVLIAASVMFIRTLRNLESQDLGFHPDGVLRVEVESERGYEPSAVVISSLLARSAAIPGVQAVTAVAGGTLATLGGVTGLQFEGFKPRDDQDRRARADWVGPDYFRVAGIRLAAGRDFAAADDESGLRVAVINQAAARYYFGSESAALSRRLTWNRRDYEIVGVAADAKYIDLRERTPRMVYFPLLQKGSGLNAIEIRSQRIDIASLVGGIRAAIRDVDPRLMVGEAVALSARMDRKLARERLLADLTGFFGALTLVLVSIGVYGTVAYSAGRRSKELGVRIALGGRRAPIVWLILRDIVIIVSAGVALGLAGSLGVGRLIQSLLFGLQPADPLTFTTAAFVLSAIAILAAIIPALRAARLDPAAVLRE